MLTVKHALVSGVVSIPIAYAVTVTICSNISSALFCGHFAFGTFMFMYLATFVVVLIVQYRMIRRRQNHDA
jgi:hypothetical protein